MPLPEPEGKLAELQRLAEGAAADQARRRAHIHLEAAIEGMISAEGDVRPVAALLLAHVGQLLDCEALERPKRAGSAP